jgi:hypothetical protein
METEYLGMQYVVMNSLLTRIGSGIYVYPRILSSSSMIRFSSRGKCRYLHYKFTYEGCSSQIYALSSISAGGWSWQESVDI